MQGKTTGGKAQRATSHPLFRIDQTAPHALPGTVAGGHLPLDRSSGDRGQQGLLLPQWIDAVLFQQTEVSEDKDCLLTNLPLRFRRICYNVFTVYSLITEGQYLLPDAVGQDY